MPGFPIRTPWDHSLVDSSPRPIAASHVLHRLLVPRHPPFALDNLTTKMLASTVQFSTNNQPTTHSPTPNPAAPPAVCETRPCLAPSRGITSDFGSETTTTRVVLSGPNRVLTSATSRTRTPFPPPRGGCTRKISGRCRRPTCQCLRHLSTPPPRSGGAGSMPPFGGWCSLERR